MDQPLPNNAATIARAFATYSLVPYLGILFCPGAVVMGTIGLAQSYRAAQPNGRGDSYFVIVAGFLVLGIQLLLWWVLYKAPEWGLSDTLQFVVPFPTSHV